MRSILNYSLAVAIISSFVACGGGHSHEGEHEAHEEAHGHEGHEHGKSAANGCILEYDSDSTKLTWTAYKTTDKVGVGGTFDDFKLGGAKEGGTVAEVFENVKFQITPSSVNSNNPDRDKKIFEHFFKTMVQGVEISGMVDEIGENHAIGYITMNGMTAKQKFDLKSDHETYCTISATLNLDKWNAAASITALNKVCFDLHKGPDGESKLWNEVLVELTVKLNKSCP